MFNVYVYVACGLLQAHLRKLVIIFKNAYFFSHTQITAFVIENFYIKPFRLDKQKMSETNKIV